MDGTLIKVKVQAGAKANRAVQRSGDSWLIAVKEPAEQGRANRAALTLLAQQLGIDAKRLAIIKGAHAPAKIILIR